MIHKLGTVIITLIIIAALGYVGLTLIRQFAFSIALENHEANNKDDAREEEQRKLKIAMADEAASHAFRKVEPLMTSTALLVKKASTDSVVGSDGGGGSSMV